MIGLITWQKPQFFSNSRRENFHINSEFVCRGQCLESLVLVRSYDDLQNARTLLRNVEEVESSMVRRFVFEG